jgi:hypothetical protein
VMRRTAEAPSLLRDRFVSYRDELMTLAKLEPQPRGYAFEKFLNSIFAEFNMAPRGSFRLRGEQIDGSFLLAQETYLLEAKWQSAPTGASQLHAFHGKVEQRAQ